MVRWFDKVCPATRLWHGNDANVVLLGRVELNSKISEMYFRGNCYLASPGKWEKMSFNEHAHRFRLFPQSLYAHYSQESEA